MKIIQCKRHHLAQRAKDRGYTWAEVAACIVEQAGDALRVDVDHPSYPMQAKPDRRAELLDRTRWPMAARMAAKLAQPGDRGLGDVVQRMAAKVGGETFKAVTKRLGINCGCNARQESLNEAYPFPA